MSHPITHREFKLPLKPQKFPARRALLDFNAILIKSAAKIGVKYEPFDSVDSQLRVVQFYDTADQVLRKNKLIFKIRQLRSASTFPHLFRGIQLPINDWLTAGTTKTALIYGDQGH